MQGLQWFKHEHIIHSFENNYSRCLLSSKSGLRTGKILRAVEQLWTPLQTWTKRAISLSCFELSHVWYGTQARPPLRQLYGASQSAWAYQSARSWPDIESRQLNHNHMSSTWNIFLASGMSKNLQWEETCYTSPIRCRIQESLMLTGM